MAIRAIHERLVADGRRNLVRTVGPNSGSTTSASWIETARADFDDCIDVYSWHSYNGDNFDTNPPKEYRGWLNLVQQGTRKLAGSLSPTGSTNTAPTGRMRACAPSPITAATWRRRWRPLSTAAARPRCIWILLDQKYPGDTTNNDSFYRGVQRWGLVPWPHDDLPDSHSPRPAWYAFGLMCRVLGGGEGFRSLRTTCDEDVYLAAVEQPGKRYAMLAVDAAYEARPVNIKLSHPLDCDVERWIYDPALVDSTKGDGLPDSNRKLHIMDSWQDVLPPRGVTLYRTV